MPKREDRKHSGGVDTGPGSIGMEGSFLDRVGKDVTHPEPLQPHPAAGPPAEWWWETNPGVGANWLPERLFPEIDELRKEHLERLADKSDAGDKKRELVARFEDEDEARKAALYASEDVPAVTSTADREDAVNEADAELYAATRRLHDFYLHAVAKFQRMAPTWRAQFAATRAVKAAKMEEAKAALRTAEREAAAVDQAEQWVERTVTPPGGRHMAAPNFGVGFMTEAEREDYRLGKHDLESVGAAS